MEKNGEYAENRSEALNKLIREEIKEELEEIIEELKNKSENRWYRILERGVFILSEIKKYLNQDQLETILPNYFSAFREISNIRDLSKNFNNFTKKDYDHFPYKNVISILGERGSGKSTVFNTIYGLLSRNFNVDEFYNTNKEKIQNEKETIKKYLEENNFNFNIIVPEMLEQSSDILGVLLLNIKDFIDLNNENILKFYKNDKTNYKSNSIGFQNCIYEDKNHLSELWEIVFSIYIRRRSEYSDIINKNFSSINDYTSEVRESLSSEIKLSEVIYKLFNELVKIFGQGSLFFFYFDDLDINQKRCREGLDTILRYLKHPNVVVFVSGDLNKFEEALIIEELFAEDAYKLEGKITIKNKDIVESKKDIIYEFLKKIMPYSNRYNLNKLSDKEKRDFKYVYKNGNTTIFKDILKKFFLCKIDDVTEVEYIIDDIPVSVYKIFDEKPRGLITVWEYIEKNFYDLKDGSNCKNPISYKNLVELIVDTNQKLGRKKDFILKELISIISNDSKVIAEINYDKFKYTIEMKESNTVEKENYIIILNLLFFVELIVNKNVKIKDFSEILNLIIAKNMEYKIYPNIDDCLYILNLYEKISDKFGIEEQKLIFDNAKYFNIYYLILEETKSENKHGDKTFNEVLSEKKLSIDNMDLKVKKELFEKFKRFEYDFSIIERKLIQDKENAVEIKGEIEGIKEKIEEAERELLNNILINNISEKIGLLDINELYKYAKDKIDKSSKIIDSIIEWINKNEYIISLYSDSKDFNNLIRNINEYVDNKWTCYQLNEVMQIIYKFFDKYSDNCMKNRSIYNESYVFNRINDGSISIKIDKAYKDALNLDEIKGKLNIIIQKGLNIKDIGSDTNKNPENLLDKFMHALLYTEVNIEYLYDPKSKKATNVKNYIQQLYNIITAKYIHIQLKDLLDDYMFINLSEIKKLLVDTNKDLKNVSFMVFNDIYAKFYSEYSNYDNIKINEFIDNRIESLYKSQEATKAQYKISEIDINKLQRISTKINNDKLRMDLENIRNKLIQNGEINKVEMTNVITNTKKYIEIFKETGEGIDLYYLLEIEGLMDNIVLKEKNKNNNLIIYDENKAKEKIYAFELEYLILFTKEVLTIQMENGNKNEADN